MSKIAIVSFGFSDSTLPLVEALSSKGHSVDCIFCFFRKDIYTCTGFDFSTPKRSYGKIYEIDYNLSKGTSFIKRFPNSSIYIYQGFKTGENARGLYRYIARNICIFYLKKLGNFIKKNNYDFVDIIAQPSFSVSLYPLLKNIPMIHSLHEVFTQHMDKRELVPIIDIAKKNNISIRVFSSIAKQSIIENSVFPGDKLYEIPFGLYNNYKDYSNTIIPELKECRDYILFTGFITPYKGIDVLLQAFKIFSLKKSNISLVIAGKGSLSSVKMGDNIIIINRWIKNEELTTLIRRCKLVVCPYLSASQSGLPQTSFVFNKPIIATEVGAFPKIIQNGENGILIQPNNIMALVDALDLMYNNSDLYNKMIRNIELFEQQNNYYSWNSIAENYSQMINEIKNNHKLYSNE